MSSRRFALGLAVGLALLPAAFAQDEVAGRYAGRVTYTPGATGQQRSDMVELQIDKVEGSRIRGTASLFYPMCREQVPVRGRVDGNTLIVVRAEPDATKRCPVNWELKLAGNKLEGHARGGQNATLSMSK